MEQDPLLGKQIGAYHIQSKLGEGGMARVYKAYQTRLRRDVAIKVILSQIADQADFRARFEREAQLIASLEHPNIVAVYDFGELNTLTYLVMQYVGGGTLRNQLRGGQPLEPRRAAQYALQMARALHHAHLRGIVHRDVKPQNMLVSSNDAQQLLLSDFGIAKLFSDGNEARPIDGALTHITGGNALTSVDQIVGTAEYMAPEQIQRGSVDARTDVYALGVVLFQMLTGQVPFQSTTALGLMYQHVNTPPKPVRDLNPRVPEILAQITATALQKAPEARFQSAEAMATALETALLPTTNPLSSSFIDNEITRRSVPLGPTQYASYPTPASNAPYTGQPFSASEAMPSTMGSMGNMSGSSAIGAIPAPATRRPNAALPVRVGIGILCILLVAAFAASKFFPIGGSSTGNGGNGTPWLQNGVYTSFTDNFKDNTHGWAGNTLNMTAIVENSRYTITVNDTNTYFPQPAPNGTTTGPLPNAFTLTVDMTHTKGTSGSLYGVAFRVTEGSNTVSCYAFVIDGVNSYRVVKYTDNNVSTLRSGQFSGIHQGLNQSNELQVNVQGTTLSFSINGQAVPINGTGQANSMTDSSFTGGQLGLLVTGQSSYAVTKVQLQV